MQHAIQAKPGAAQAIWAQRQPHYPADHPALPQAFVAEALCAHLHDARIVDIEGGGIPLPDQMPEAFARAVDAFLRGDPGGVAAFPRERRRRLADAG